MVRGRAACTALDGAEGTATEPGHILVVEDHPATAGLLVDVLRAEGYRVVVAPDGAAAVDHLAAARQAADPARLVLLDLMLPGITGIGVLHWLARHAPALPVIALSASASALATADTLGVQAAVQKPFELDQLLALVARYDSPPRSRPR